MTRFSDTRKQIIEIRSGRTIVGRVHKCHAFYVLEIFYFDEKKMNL